jgi:hypothetical protein
MSAESVYLGHELGKEAEFIYNGKPLHFVLELNLFGGNYGL